MTTARPRFSFFVHFYVALFFAMIAILPVWAAAGHWSSPYRPVLLLWPCLVGLSYWYANLRCSGDASFYEDLLYLSAFMMAGTLYLSFFVVLPILLVSFGFALVAAAFGDLKRDPNYARTQWSTWIQFFYRHRMVQ